MIAKLTGIIDTLAQGYLILDVNGVGYLVQASNRTLSRIGRKGDPASLLIETVIREDAFTLFGFADKAEQEWFKLLTSVQGVGAKAGLAILSVNTPDKIALAIVAQDKAAIRAADGVGPKLATRILTELKDKAGNIDLGASSQSASYSEIASDAPQTDNQIDSDAISALVNLGYARSDAFTAVTKAKAEANDNLQDLIRLALKELSA
ncbi:MAG: Holliday junction branch migration protein RuvA [Alphaproteobacteria bacterium]|nr:Holliday junction branch migration protein RuvA [Alphaproteobacteria bacterium]